MYCRFFSRFLVSWLIGVIFFFGSFSVALKVDAQQSNGKPVQEENIEAVVGAVKEERAYQEQGVQQLYQRLELIVTSGKNKGKKIIVESGDIPSVQIKKYEVGDTLLVTHTKAFDGKDMYFVADYVRRDALIWLFGIFIIVALFIGTKKGLLSLLGLAFSFFVIFSFLLPQILQGHNPILVAIIASLFIVPVTFYLSHGINKKTTAAVIGTYIALILTGILASAFVNMAQLSGFASEEAGFLNVIKGGEINIKGLLLAGIIVSVLGILDDITVSQASVVYQLKALSPKISFQELYFRSMEVGKDHIASVINTLMLVYAGASMPLLLLFIDNPSPLSQVINQEIIAEEIVRTLVASIGLIMAVPITTLLTTLLVQRRVRNRAV